MNDIDKSIILLRELQTMLFNGNEIDINILFSKTLEIDNTLNNASVIYNKYLNDKEKKIIKNG